MRIFSKRRYWLYLYLIFFLLASKSVSASTPLEVFVSVPPHAFMAEQLGGKHLSVSSLIGAGQDPHTFTPSPRQIIALSRADIFFATGMEFEKQLLPKIKGINRQLHVVSLGRIPEEVESVQLHSSPNGHQHDHELDSHLWLSPDSLIEQAAKMVRGLTEFDRERQEFYRARLEAFSNKVKDQKESIKQQLAPYAGRSFFVFHPAFGHFGQAFDLHQVAVESGGTAPSPRQLAALVKKAKEERIKVIFTQPQFNQRSAAVIAQAINGRVVLADPMAWDIIKNYGDFAASLKASFAE